MYTITSEHFTIECDSIDEVFSMYCLLGRNYSLTINGIILEKMGKREDGSYFVGYTCSYFQHILTK